jgi:RNA polymerase sigma factor for flagellar operon FliA
VYCPEFRPPSRVPSTQLEDLVSAGVTGLLQAYQRFDEKRNLRLKTLASHRIRGAMLDYLRQLDPLPRTLRRFQKKREAAMVRLSQDSDSELSEEQLARELGLPLKKYRRLLREAQAQTVLSLDTHSHDDARPLEVVAPDDQTPEHSVLCNRVERAIHRLSNSERGVIMALKDGETTREIARALHITEGRVGQIKKKAIQRLQLELGVTRRGDLGVRMDKLLRLGQ